MGESGAGTGWRIRQQAEGAAAGRRARPPSLDGGTRRVDFFRSAAVVGAHPRVPAAGIRCFYGRPRQPTATGLQLPIPSLMLRDSVPRNKKVHHEVGWPWI
ncbi:hypothetical protein Sgleb_64810 [Streptomyces glebosus]|uniref:Uncharacterized protein n=1 Tax=Streptomyces glebosus TaxID=249580 RepID=A0A640T5E0_9ACTN|nr:hypothetical protein Sgleb_64810 [Streptomyces glebosus]GHG58709.1 hypothetical protein GCM10010513_23040 [Streptomyces glebosus]